MTHNAEFATVAEALDYLEDFGHPSLIARELERRGIRAVIGNSEACALAMFVTEACHSFRVFVAETHVSTLSYNPDDGYSHYPTPKQVSRFINMFDSGRFPNLVYTRATKEIAA